MDMSFGLYLMFLYILSLRVSGQAQEGIAHRTRIVLKNIITWVKVGTTSSIIVQSRGRDQKEPE